MPRPRLSPEEREARRKARNAFTFSDAAYKHYNPRKDGFGRPEDWEDAAEALFGDGAEAEHAAWGRSEFDASPKSARPEQPRPRDRFLIALGLDFLPDTIEGLKRAFRNAMMIAHPDHGGTNEAARAVLEAFAVLKRRF